MKTLIIIIFLATIGTVSHAQDTAYISRVKTTALFFKSSVKIIGKTPPDFEIRQVENGFKVLRTGHIGNGDDMGRLATST